MTHFGNRLKELRTSAGISQRSLAAQANVDFSYISKLENGRIAAPAADTVIRLAAILNCSASELLAAAGKLPGALDRDIATQPGAIRFLQDASELHLKETEWEKLRQHLRSMRSELPEIHGD